MPELALDSAAGSTALRYPFEGAPVPGSAHRVAPGVLWLRLPLPMAGLNHINVWALEDGGGWTLDTGHRQDSRGGPPEGRAAAARAFG